MGASNAVRAFALWSHLDHRELRGLLFMSLISMDKDDPPVYWGGWESLAEAMGYDVKASPEGARRSTMRVLAALVRAGVIVSSGQARQGTRAEYALALSPETTFKPVGRGRQVTWEVTPRITKGVTAGDTLQRDSSGHPTCDSQGQKGVTAGDTPRKEPQEQQRNTGEESTSVDLFSHQGGVIENDSSGEIFSSPPKADRIRSDTKAEVEDERRRQSAALEKLIREQQEVA